MAQRSRTKTEAKTDAADKAKTAKRVTKRARLIRMLRHKAGADVAAISAEMGWLPHSTRAALSGLRKAGFALEATKPEGGGASRYRIAGAPGQATS